MSGDWRHPRFPLPEIMRAEQTPDVLGDGARWVGGGEGDKDGPSDVGETVQLAASTFPPGTVISVLVPVCPDCDHSADHAFDVGTGVMSKCACGHDWPLWVKERFPL